jgi:hypothetical protein
MPVFLVSGQATTRTTVRGSWEKAGFGFEERDGTYYLWVDEAKIRRIREFSEVLNINHPETAISPRRRQQK